MSGQARDAASTTDRAVLTAAIASGALIAQLVAGKATRDTLFLTHFGIQLLPVAMIGAALVSSVAVIAISRALTRHGPGRVVPLMFALAGACFLGEWALSLQSERAAALAVYLHTAIFSAATGSAFWSLVNERFDPHEAKRSVGSIAGGGTVGGVLGGLVVWRAAEHLSVSTMLAILAFINVIGFAACSRLTKSGAATQAHEPIAAGGGLRILRETPYLQHLALLVAVGAATQALLDWVVSAHAAAEYGTGRPLLGFFALFNMIVGVASFAAQAGLSRPLLERFGLAQTVKVQPVAVAACCGLALVSPGLSSIVLLRGVEAVLRNSLFRSAYELFYTPLPMSAKRPSKTLIDVGFDRIGTTVGGLALLALAYLAPATATLAVLILTICLSLAAWLLAARLHSGYVAALTDNLKSGTVALDDGYSLDFTTKQTLAETTARLDRGELLARIEKFQKDKEARAADVQRQKSSTGGGVIIGGLIPRAAPSGKGFEISAGSFGDPLQRNVELLRSTEPQRLKAGLAMLDPACAALAVPLLANDLVVRDAVRALRKVAPKMTGLLLDSLLDFDVDPRVRRRIPRVLKVCRTQRAASGMMLALHDPIFDVRVEVALGLAQLAREVEVAIDRETLFDIVQEELTTGRRGWPRSAPKTELEGPASGPPRTSDDLARGLAHVFTLLSLVLEKDPLSMAYRALRSDDPALRGTAIEYLEVVLPTRLRETITPLLGDVKRAPKTKARDQNELAKELLRSGAGLPRVKLPAVTED